MWGGARGAPSAPAPTARRKMPPASSPSGTTARASSPTATTTTASQAPATRVLCIRAARTEEGPEETKNWAEGTARDRWQQPLHTRCYTKRYNGKHQLGMPARMKEHCLLRPTGGAKQDQQGRRGHKDQKDRRGTRRNQKWPEGNAGDHWQQL